VLDRVTIYLGPGDTSSLKTLVVRARVDSALLGHRICSRRSNAPTDILRARSLTSLSSGARCGRPLGLPDCPARQLVRLRLLLPVFCLLAGKVIPPYS
jgi:hypothetical protein